MTLAAKLRSHSLSREVRALAPRYDATPAPAERARIQLELLNRVWAQARRQVPHYRELAQRRGLPECWSNLEEFVASLPTTGRQDLQSAGSRLLSQQRPPDQWRATGGSTAQPIQIPQWRSEVSATRANAWLGRSWYGIQPDDRLFLLWGHSHLLGSGVRGWLNARRRELEDRLLGYYRFSAYDIGRQAMERAIERILAFRPDYIIGYSVALDRLGRAAQSQSDRLRRLGVKAVIATAEGFPSPDSGARLSDALGCPVAMEYGAVEALGIAHTHPDGGYRLFWGSYLAEAQRVAGRRVLRLTSLYPRSMPLLRYEIGDEVELPPDAAEEVVGLTRFERVLGRCNDYVELGDGTCVHSEAFSHAIRPCPQVRGYQVVQQGSNVELHIVVSGELPEPEEAGLKRRLARIHAELAATPVKRASSLQRTVAGKTPMIIRR